MSQKKQRLLGMTLDELKTATTALGMSSFTAKQICQWLYMKHVRSIDDMTNISKANRELLKENYEVGFLPPADMQRSKDGTIKYLFPVAGGRRKDNNSQGTDIASRQYVETVYIPDGDRATLCVSCQVGCKMNCLFCQTGKQGWHGDLTAADILNQIFALPPIDGLSTGSSITGTDKLTNIVFMGQGEPMDNLDAILTACNILTADWGWQWSPRRITVSSVGIKGKLKRFLDESECHVAISMHSPIHEQRRQLMPAENSMAIAETVAMLKQYDFSHQKRCTFEYICFGGMNDTMVHAREIVRLLQGLECRVNLIRFHEIPDAGLPSSNEKRMEALRDYLNSHGITTTIRASRGQDIMAACGLLSTAKNKEIIKNQNL